VGTKKGVTWTVVVAQICIHCYRKSFYRLFTSKLFTNLIYVQAAYVPRRAALSLIEAICSYSEFVVFHG
jgi:hypothetical protein